MKIPVLFYMENGLALFQISFNSGRDLPRRHRVHRERLLKVSEFVRSGITVLSLLLQAMGVWGDICFRQVIVVTFTNENRHVSGLE